MWVSFNAHTDEITDIGVPSAPSGIVFQEEISNLKIFSSIPSLNGKGLNGNIEFWPTDYGTTNQDNVSGASDTVYDWGDEYTDSGNYGSMQIHSSDLGSTLFSMNRWNENHVLDVGIGNAPDSENTDWTFHENALTTSQGSVEWFELIRQSLTSLSTYSAMMDIVNEGLLKCIREEDDDDVFISLNEVLSNGKVNMKKLKIILKMTTRIMIGPLAFGEKDKIIW